jgi:hypothetical protein
MVDKKKVIDLNDVPDGMTLKQHIYNLEQEQAFLEKEKEQFLHMFGPMPDPIENPFLGKGIIPQIEDKEAPYGSAIGELTVDKLMSFLQDIMASPDAPKLMVMLTGCIEKGIVTQSSVEFNLCNNPNCKTCRNLEDALTKQCK